MKVWDEIMGNSIGIIETVGYTAALRAVDMMVKMAYVEVIKIEYIGAGRVSVIIEGDIESIKTALEIGADAAQSIGELVGVHSIAKPLFKIKPDSLEEELIEKGEEIDEGI